MHDSVGFPLCTGTKKCYSYIFGFNSSRLRNGACEMWHFAVWRKVCHILLAIFFFTHVLIDICWWRNFFHFCRVASLCFFCVQWIIVFFSHLTFIILNQYHDVLSMQRILHRAYSCLSVDSFILYLCSYKKQKGSKIETWLLQCRKDLPNIDCTNQKNFINIQIGHITAPNRIYAA